MEIGAQGIGGKEWFPTPWSEWPDFGNRMRADPLQDIDQVVVRIDLMEPVGGDEGLHDAHRLGTDLGPAEHPGFSAHGNRA